MELIDNFYSLYNSIEKVHDRYLYTYKKVGGKNVSVKKSFHEIHEDIHTAYSNLKNAGFKSNKSVGIWLDNQYEFFVVDFALTLLGIQEILISHLEETATVEERLARFNATVIIQKDNEKKKLKDNIKTYGVSDFMKNTADMCEVTKESVADMDFMITYSSGTSGRSKGLGASEKGFFSNCDIYFDHMKYNTNDRLLVFLPLSSYQQHFLIWACLSKSIDVVLLDDKSIYKGLKEFKPNIILAPPNFYFNAFRLNDDNNAFKRFLRKKLPYNNRSKLLLWIAEKITYKKLYEVFGHRPRYLLTGMAPIDIQLLEYFHNAYLEIYQIYGQTEIGMICGNTTFNNKIGTVGKPILQIHIADDGEVITYNEYPTVNNYYLDDGTVQPLPPHERPSGDIGDIDDEGFVTLRGRKNEAIILSNGKKVNPVEIENRIKNKFNLDEVLIFKRNDAESEHILDIVVFYGVGGKEMTNAKDIKDVISEYQELKYNSEEIRLSLFMIEDSEKTAIYTENGKFSRVNAAKFIKSNIDRLENINYMR